MGSDDKSRKRRSSPSSPSQDDKDKRRKHQKGDESEKRRRKDEEKDKKKKKEKSHKHSSREKKEKKSREKHKKSKNNSDFAVQELTKDDYFSKNNEFSTWLKEERGKYFNDLSSEDAHELFSSFVKAWNSGKLESQYYEGIVTAPRTSHNWKIRNDK